MGSLKKKTKKHKVFLLLVFYFFFSFFPFYIPCLIIRKFQFHHKLKKGLFLIKVFFNLETIFFSFNLVLFFFQEKMKNIHKYSLGIESCFFKFFFYNLCKKKKLELL